MAQAGHNPERLVRKKRIDPRLDRLGWNRSTPSVPAVHPHRVEEYEATQGPADYALGIDGRVLGIIEAKKLTLGPQNVLTQAERYSKGATSNPPNYAGYRVGGHVMRPFEHRAGAGPSVERSYRQVRWRVATSTPPSGAGRIRSCPA